MTQSERSRKERKKERKKEKIEKKERKKEKKTEWENDRWKRHVRDCFPETFSFP